MEVIKTHAEALLNIMANPSLRVSKENQKEFRRVLTAITDQAQIQNNAINTLVGRLMEQRDITNNILNRKETVKSYEEVTKQKERQRSRSRKRNESIVALIYPNTEGEIELTREAIKNNINPVNLGLGIRKVRKINKGGVIMELEHKTDFDKLEIELLSNDILRENFLIRKGTK